MKHSRSMNANAVNAVQKTREIFVLANSLNNSFKVPVMSMLVYGWVIADVVSMYSIIRLRESLPALVFGFFLFLGYEGFLFIHFLFRDLRKPSEAFVEFHRNTLSLLRTKSGRNQKYLGRMLWSFHPVAVTSHNGGTFDNLTSLTIWQLCVDSLINLLLLTK